MKKYKLGELLDVTRGASLSGEYYSTEGEFIRLTLGNFDYQNGGFKENTSKDDLFFMGTVKPQFILNEGDIITPLTEQTQGLIGSTARIPQSGVYIQSQDVGLVKCNGELLDPDFCYYLLPSQIVKKQLSAGAQQTKIRHTSPDKIKDVTVFLPELSEQRKIGHILRSIDSQIDNLTAINRNLEQFARQLYDYWFVQFDFPNSEGKPYKSSGGEMVWNEKLKRSIPKDWKVVALDSLIDDSRGISYNGSMILGSGIPMINLASFNIDGTYKHSGLKYFNGVYSSNKVLKPFDLVMCNTQQTAIDEKKDIIGKAFLIPALFESDVVSSHHVTTIICKSEEIKPFLAYLFNTRHFHKYAAGCCSGTNIMGLDMKNLKKYELEIPSKELLKRFSRLIIDIESQKSINVKKVLCFKKIRDELLPMLLNGRVNCDLSK